MIISEIFWGCLRFFTWDIFLEIKGVWNCSEGATIEGKMSWVMWAECRWMKLNDKFNTGKCFLPCVLTWQYIHNPQVWETHKDYEMCNILSPNSEFLRYNVGKEPIYFIWHLGARLQILLFLNLLIQGNNYQMQ